MARRSSFYLLTVTVIILLAIVSSNSPVDAFKIRSKGKDVTKDSKNSFDTESTSGDTKHRSKVADYLKDTALDDDEDDDNVEILTDDEVENASAEKDQKKNDDFVFTKVRKAHASVPDIKNKNKKKMRKVGDGDTSAVNDDDNDDDTTTTRFELRSVIDAINSWFSSMKSKQTPPASEVNEPKQMLKKDETKQNYVNESKVNKNDTGDGGSKQNGMRTADGATSDNEKTKGKKKKGKRGWLSSYLEKLPLGFLRDFVAEGQTNEDDDDEPNLMIELPKILKPTAQMIEDVMKSVKEKVAKPKRKPAPVVTMPYEEFEKILLNVPSFVPNYTKIHNFECQMQGQIFERQLRGHKAWTHQMIDSTAKITTGLLRGNMNQLGDYDLCTGIATKVKITNEESVKIRGKYCLAHIEITAFEEELKKPLHLIQGKGLLKSSLDDVSALFKPKNVHTKILLVPILLPLVLFERKT